MIHISPLMDSYQFISLFLMNVYLIVFSVCEIHIIHKGKINGIDWSLPHGAIVIVKETINKVDV